LSPREPVNSSTHHSSALHNADFCAGCDLFSCAINAPLNDCGFSAIVHRLTSDFSIASRSPPSLSAANRFSNAGTCAGPPSSPIRRIAAERIVRPSGSRH
jgi:hypothetical protein